MSTAFATALQATVKDAGSNPVSGVVVTFTAPASGPSGTFGRSATATATTNSSGVATATAFTANATAGTYSVTASVSGVATPASFSLTNTAGTAASITATAGTPQSATVSTAFATALQATVKDTSSNPVKGVVVTFTAPGSGASGTFAGGNDHSDHQQQRRGNSDGVHGQCDGGQLQRDGERIGSCDSGQLQPDEYGGNGGQSSRPPAGHRRARR